MDMQCTYSFRRSWDLVRYNGGAMKILGTVLEYLWGKKPPPQNDFTGFALKIGANYLNSA